MSVLLETSFGDVVVDLFTNRAPLASTNFLKLCKIKHYNDALFMQVQKGKSEIIQIISPRYLLTRLLTYGTLQVDLKANTLVIKLMLRVRSIKWDCWQLLTLALILTIVSSFLLLQKPICLLCRESTLSLAR